jgi:hypothetical protein
MEDEEKPRSELEDVIQQEMRRGRRPIDLQERRRRRELARYCKSLLEFGTTEEELLGVLRATGLRDGSPEFAEAVRVWRENRAR